jgi:hypothetical protein
MKVYPMFLHYDLLDISLKIIYLYVIDGTKFLTCLNMSDVRKGESPANTTDLHGICIPRERVPVAVTIYNDKKKYIHITTIDHKENTFLHIC